MPLTRSETMARIRGKETTPERMLRAALWAGGLRYRLHLRTPVGRPDIVFKGAKVAVFVDGCFWHGCPRHYVRPRSRTTFWSKKLASNLERDRRQTTQLEAEGWRVCRIWEHDVIEDLPSAVAEIKRALKIQAWRPRRCWRVARVRPLGRHGLEFRRLEDLRRRDVVREEKRMRTTAKARVSKRRAK